MQAFQWVNRGHTIYFVGVYTVFQKGIHQTHFDNYVKS